METGLAQFWGKLITKVVHIENLAESNFLLRNNKFVAVCQFDSLLLLIPRLPELGKLGKAVVRHRISLE